MKVTDWFPPEVNPVHIGVYKTVCKGEMGLEGAPDNFAGYQYWNGEYWGGFSHDPEGAAYEATIGYRSVFQNNYWQGVERE